MEILYNGLTYSKHTFFKCLSNNHVQNIVQKRNAVNLSHKIYGQAPSSRSIPIFVLHGLLGSKKNWNTLSKYLAATNNTSVVTPDLRNHGESPHESSHTYPELASDVLLLMTKFKVDKAHIIGHSMGGRTGMVLALTQAARVQSLLVLDISPVSSTGLRNSFVPRLLESMKAIDFRGMDANQARDHARSKLMGSGVVDHPGLMSFVLMSLGHKTDGSIGWLVNVDALQRHFADIATFPAEMSGKTYDGPTLFIGGGQSGYIPPEDLPGIKGFFPKVHLKYIKDVGHNVHAENPEEFLSMAKEFISRNK